jgi:hypothetical protein
LGRGAYGVFVDHVEESVEEGLLEHVAAAHHLARAAQDELKAHKPLTRLHIVAHPGAQLVRLHLALKVLHQRRPAAQPLQQPHTSRSFRRSTKGKCKVFPQFTNIKNPISHQKETNAYIDMSNLCEPFSRSCTTFVKEINVTDFVPEF